MKLKITLIKDNGEEVDYSRQIGELDSSNILKSVEREVVAVQRELSPFLSENLIESHQQGFVGKKNQEEKWDTRSSSVRTSRSVSDKESKIHP